MTRNPSLQADVFALARERRAIDGELPLADLPRLAASLLSTDGRLRYRIRGEIDERGRAGAAMHLHALLPMECQRCGARVDILLDRSARFRFVADEQQLGATPDDDDDVDVIVGEPHMDVVPWMEDEAILSLPLVPRHDPDDPACRPAMALGAGDAPAAAEDARPNPFSLLTGLKSRDRPN